MMDRSLARVYFPCCLAMLMLVLNASSVQAQQDNQLAVTPQKAAVLVNASDVDEFAKSEIASSIAPGASLVLPPASDSVAESATLPHNLSPWGMFKAADWVVKAVMIGLALASLLTWTVLVSKTLELGALKRLLKHNLGKINRAHALADIANAEGVRGVGRELIDAAEAELQLSVDMLKKEEGKEAIKEGIKERVISSLSRIEVASTRRMMVGTGLLATIGAVAPFVGLFGTVWGIMNSFIGISQANTTNLAVVAPGIAEALLATALGLVAAIPAVVIYNHFTRQIAGAKALVSDSSAGIMRLLSRDLDRGTMLRVVSSSTESLAENKSKQAP